MTAKTVSATSADRKPGQRRAAAPKPAKTVEDIHEMNGRLLREVERLEAQRTADLKRINMLLDEAESAAKELVDVRAYNRAELDRAQKDTAGAFNIVDNLKAENNGLRTIIRDLELTVERHRGYADGVRDAEPPRMVSEVRESRRDAWPYPQSELQAEAPSSNGLTGRWTAPKPWWHK